METVDRALAALGDPTRRDLYERILVRPSRAGFLAEASGVTIANVRHHVKVLVEARLIQNELGLYLATRDVLPELRCYFDRLWFEASVGEAFLHERYAASRRLQWRSVEVGGAALDAS